MLSVLFRPLYQTKNRRKDEKIGQGYNNEAIQDNIKEWADYQVGRICISVQSTYIIIPLVSFS